MKKAMIDYMQNVKNDELYTPEYAIKPLLKYLPKNITIWECTDYGSSNITKLLNERGYKVIKTHKDNFDFLQDIPDFDFDMIITNPPYSLKDEFIKRCNFIYNDAKKSNWFNTSWFCWNVLPKQLIFEELKKDV